jgi:outer membrane protein OmpA-like peptidoglycan-associated protein
MTLSRDRANSVMQQLIGLGISPNRITAEGYGETHPVANNSTEAGRAQNRRVALQVTQK